MIHEHEATEWASAAMDFPLADHEERWLQHELADCPVCAERATAYHEQLRMLQRLPVMSASDRTRIRITQAATTGRVDTRSPMMLVLAAAVLVAMMLGAVAAVGAWLSTRQPDQLTVVDPSQGPSSEIPPASVDPTTFPPPSGGRPVLATDSVATVVAKNVRVRSYPSVDEAVSVRFEPFLQPGDRLFVLAGPVVADDYDWYQVAPIGGAGSRPAGELPSGWVSVSDHDGSPWIAPSEPDCPVDPIDVEALEMMEPLARVACFSKREMTLPVIVDRDAAGAWTAKSRSTRVGSTGNPLGIRNRPGSDGSTETLQSGQMVVLKGSFDQADSLGCRGAPPAPTVSDEEISCRSQFAVDSVDPDPFPLVPGRIAKTVTTGLRVRSEPYVGDGSEMLEPLLGNGIELAVVDGPVLSSGYTWYEVIVPSIASPQSEGPFMIGWVAVASREGERWASQVVAACPDPEELGVAALMDLTRPPSIHGGYECFGAGTAVDGGTLSIQGRVGVVCNDPALVDDRDWLGLGAHTLVIEAEGAVIRARPHPDLDASLDCEAPPDPATYSIEGHFDDPAAAACLSDKPIWVGVPAYDNRIDMYACRSLFVVTAIRPSG